MNDLMTVLSVVMQLSRIAFFIYFGTMVAAFILSQKGRYSAAHKCGLAALISAVVLTVIALVSCALMPVIGNFINAVIWGVITGFSWWNIKRLSG